MKGRIAEVFDSIQGEGLYLGEKQIFVRFFGCNLACKFCDTKLHSFMEYEPEELFQELKLYQDKYHSVSFTGGEPLLQKDFLKELMQMTRRHNFRNYLETNGILHEALKEVIDYVDIVAMDLKLPSSTGLGDFWEEHRLFLKIASQREVFLKAVICSQTKEEDLKKGLRMMRERCRGSTFPSLRRRQRPERYTALPPKWTTPTFLLSMARTTVRVASKMPASA